MGTKWLDQEKERVSRVTYMTKRNEYTLAELEAMPTLSQGQTDDLKIDTGAGERVWLSRMTVEDGMPHDHQVCVEHYIPGEGCWVTVYTYQAR